ncbi:Protein 21.1 [Giardia lamblia P15]|uniref:Protein 21.1 n=1 Tax=Giardia intestinalis (strain P15) TaxID=658858 RepID=E1EVS4_GIAIA|nr:Protein 21.1 [Giardia lamblia P15]
MDGRSADTLHDLDGDLDMSHSNLAHLFFDMEPPLTSAEVTPLMVAAAKNDLAALEAHILEHRGAKTSHGITALMFAAAMGNVRAVQHLSRFEAGRTDHHGRTALMFAAENRQLEAMRILARYEARKQTHHGTTALMIATRRNHTEGAQLLSSYEAGMQDAVGFTALMLAAERDYFKIIRVLLERESRMTTTKGVTALMMAVTCNKRISARILALKEAGMQCGHGLTALMMAANNGNADLVDLLKAEEGGLQTENGATALMNAVVHRRVPVIRLLIDQEARLQNKSGQTATMLAAKEDYFDGVKELARYEAGIKDNRSMTAYAIACELGHQNIADYLEPLEGGNISKPVEDALALLSSSLQLSSTPASKHASVHDTDSTEKFTYTPDATYFIPASPAQGSILYRRTNRAKSASVHPDDVSMSDLFYTIGETNPSRHKRIKSDRFSIDSNDSNQSPSISARRPLRSSTLNSNIFSRYILSQDPAMYIPVGDTLLLHQKFRAGISHHLKTTTELTRILTELRDRHQESAPLITALQRQIGSHLQFTSSLLDFVTDAIALNDNPTRTNDDIQSLLMALMQQLSGNEAPVAETVAQSPHVDQESAPATTTTNSTKERTSSFVTLTRKIFSKFLKRKEEDHLETTGRVDMDDGNSLSNTCIRCGAPLPDLLQIMCPLCS